MTIVGCRIDGRLIHGQVANLWTAKLNVSRIMVVDNDVVNNDVEIFLLGNTIANVYLL